MSIRPVALPRSAFAQTVRVPGDKSLSHRALIFAAMASGKSQVIGGGPGADVASTRRVLTHLGVEYDGITIRSKGVDRWQSPEAPLDCGNSGTTLRLLAGALAARPFRSTLVGDASLMVRPMRRLVDPLEALGARVRLGHGGRPPVEVGARGPLRGADVEIPIASAQVRSAFELAALQAEDAASIHGPTGYRDHTERWLTAWGLGERTDDGRYRVLPGNVPAWKYDVPGDPSSAAFLWTLAAARRDAVVTTPEVSLNPGRIGFLQVLEMFGAEISAEVTSMILGDPIGSVTVRGRGLFHAEVDGELAVAALDELPLVAVLGALGEGVTRVRGAAELRAKESDRIAATVDMIRALGGGAERLDDGFVVLGTGFLEPGVVETQGDHRIAMAAAVAAIGVDGEVAIDGAEVAGISWPGFYEQVMALWS
ncbi:MAG TPA: 3-phosphoshikimate 1-carboxyvinyltransferase [Acidimicrobiia bacterium]|jgi:3-phosphoshikimate 1-carboxyvinyltransferase|nr:3-phosphoshikimate 1-carboxyvinyltransferase [Acidimicrobiia bacterium]